MAEHTPGPWSYETHGAFNFLVKAGDNCVASIDSGVCNRKFPGYAQSRADAALIAAAPDMLAALQILAGAEPGPQYTGWIPPNELREVIFAAIAKATGA